MLYLGLLTGLAPADEAGRLKVGQVFLTLCDLQNETVRSVLDCLFVWISLD